MTQFQAQSQVSGFFSPTKHKALELMKIRMQFQPISWLSSSKHTGIQLGKTISAHNPHQGSNLLTNHFMNLEVRLSVCLSPCAANNQNQQLLES